MFESAPSSFPTAHKHRPVSTKRTISLFPLSLSPFDFHYPYVDPNTIPSIPQRHLFFHSRLSHFSSLHPHLPYPFFLSSFSVSPSLSDRTSASLFALLSLPISVSVISTPGSVVSEPVFVVSTSVSIVSISVPVSVFISSPVIFSPFDTARSV